MLRDAGAFPAAPFVSFAPEQRLAFTRYGLTLHKKVPIKAADDYYMLLHKYVTTPIPGKMPTARSNYDPPG